MSRWFTWPYRCLLIQFNVTKVWQVTRHFNSKMFSGCNFEMEGKLIFSICAFMYINDIYIFVNSNTRIVARNFEADCYVDRNHLLTVFERFVNKVLWKGVNKLCYLLCFLLFVNKVLGFECVNWHLFGWD
jgi:hypothetical protein